MTAAQQQLHAVFQSTMECVAAVCDELEPVRVSFDPSKKTAALKKGFPP